jgi:hypothetical protein
LAVWGAVAALLAALAHPVSVLLLGGLGVWVVTVYLKRAQLARLWAQPRVRWGAFAAAVLAVVIALRFIPMLQQWVLQHDKVPVSERGGEFLLHSPGGRGVKQMSLLLAYVVNLTPPLVLAGLLGIYILWQRRERDLALLLVCLFLVPIAFIALVSLRTAVSTFYLIPTIPVVFLGAGVFVNRLIGTHLGVRPAWLIAAAVTFMIFADGAPTLISQYRDGRRWDFRGAARWLEERLTPGDIIYSDQPQVVAYYLRGKTVQRLVADPERLARAQGTVLQAGGRALWIVAPAPSHAFRTNPRLSSLNDWIYANCQLKNQIGVGRVDFRQNFLQIFRCAPATQAARAEASAARSPAPRRGLPA